MGRRLNVAIVGVTGAVGETFLKVLEERSFPIENLYALASQRSAGKTIFFKNKPEVVSNLEQFDFRKADLALFSAGSAISLDYVPKAVAAGCLVIDNTSAFRYDDDIPLIVPEVNAHRIIDYRKKGIIANPNCSTIQMVVALKPLFEAVGIARINIATYQAVSGTGNQAIHELMTQIKSLMQEEPINSEIYPKQIAFNVLPHIDEFQENGYSREEMKIVWETKKILEDDTILINPTTVRVPVLYGHSEAIHLELKAKLSVADARALLEAAPGVKVIDDLKTLTYPTAATHAFDSDEVFVGRIREDISHSLGLNLWVVANNIRKGAATNAIQIAEIMQQLYL